jgi:flagellar basal-body rod modification protein FlgD
MSVGAIDGLGIDSLREAEEARRRSEDAVGQNDFLQMLVAQLENQDPLNPQDSADFAAQLAQFSSVEQLIAMRTGIDKLVTALNDREEGGDAPAALDPTSLIGREVVVFGNQIEVDSEQSPITLPLRTRDTAVEANVRVYDANGTLRHRASILPRDEQGREIALRPGDHSFAFDPAAHGLPEGTYRIEFTARGTDDEPVTVLPMVTGVVTGAILAGEPAIRMGNRIFSLEDILEVRLAPGTGTQTSSSPVPTPSVGGGLTVTRPTGQTVSS